MTRTTLRAKSVVLFVFTLFSLTTAAWAGLEEEIRDHVRRNLDAVEAGDAEVIAASYAEDGQLVGPGRAVLQGRAAIQQSLARWFRNSSSRQYDDLQIELQTYQDTVVVLYVTYTLKWVDRGAWL